MSYVKHIKSDTVYGTLSEGVFCQHKWVSLNKKPIEGRARGDVGQLTHTNKNIENISDYESITNEEYENLFYKDYNKIN